jgi:Transmembrane secretion effector
MQLIRLSLLGTIPFRALALSVVGNSVGTVGEQVVLGWLTLELTNSPVIVGAALGMRMAPLLLVGFPAGIVADRAERHRLLQASGVAMAVATGTIGLLALFGAARLWHVLVLTFVAGCVRAFHQAARQSYAHDLVGRANLVDGLAVLGLAMRVGGLVGSLLTGWLIAGFGTGVAYLAVAAGYLSGALTLLPVALPGSEAAAARESAWRNLVGFLAAVRRDRTLLLVIVLTASAEILGFSHQALLPSLARDVLAVGPEGLGAMTAARSVGGILGIVSIAGLGQLGGNGPLFLGILIVFGGSLTALGVAPGYGWVLLILTVVNATGAVSDILSQSLIQLAAPGGLRGRAGGAWVVAIGTAPLGQFQIGALASLLGVAPALAASGLALVLVATAGALLPSRLRSL